jgi:hypothetical protein
MSGISPDSKNLLNADNRPFIGKAKFSKCRQYRYTLERLWEPSQTESVLFVGLNPSTADAETDDPTVRRMGQFARDWGFGKMTVCNLFAFRATDPRVLKRARDPVGPANIRVLRDQARRANLIVACWGNHGQWQAQAARALPLFMSATRPLICFGLTSLGEPKHPLYLRRSLAPVPLPDVSLQESGRRVRQNARDSDSNTQPAPDARPRRR